VYHQRKKIRMKLWLLKPIKDLKKEYSPWEDPWWDKTVGFVIRAETEKEAREIATENGGDEINKDYFAGGDKNAWLSEKFSTCEELTGEGEAGVILMDYTSA
jgi:hypothetical protein